MTIGQAKHSQILHQKHDKAGYIKENLSTGFNEMKEKFWI